MTRLDRPDLSALARLQGLASVIAGLKGHRRSALAFAAGAASVLALAPFHASPVLFVTLAVLVWLIDGTCPDSAGGDGRSSRERETGGSTAPRAEGSARPMSTWRSHPVAVAGFIGWWFGFGYFIVGLAWIGEAFLVEAETFAWLLPFAVTLLPAALAVFMAAATAAARAWWPSGLARVLVLAIALGCSEWLRGHLFTGFPWNLLGYALTWPLALAQSAAIAGVYALVPIAVVVFAAPLSCAVGPLAGRSTDSGRHPPAWLGVAVAAVVVATLFGYGAARLSSHPTAFVPGVQLRIVQPSIPQRQKWLPAYQRQNFDIHLGLSRTNAQGRVDDLAGITHLVWPEAAMPFLPLQRPEALAELAALLPPRTLLLSGALRLEAGSVAPSEALQDTARRNDPRRRAYNSLMVFGFGGGLAGLYDKIHLVPFGEYLPFQRWLEAIGLRQLTQMRGGFTAGRTPRPLLAVAGLPPVGVLVCYEAIFPDEIIGDGRPGLLLNVTNDGWFGHSIGPWQHLHQARIRAIEQGLALIRAANNGISAVIDANGRILDARDIDVRGVIDARLPQALAPTIFVRFGTWMLPLVLMLLIAVAAACASASRTLDRK